MNNNDTSSKISWVIRCFMLLLAITFVLIALVFYDLKLVFFALVLLWLQNVAYGLKDLRKHIIYLAFHAAFFLFLMGRPVASMIRHGSYGLSFPDEIVFNIFLMLFVSLLFCFISYALPALKEPVRHLTGENKEESLFRRDWEASFGTVSKWLFYGTALFWFLQQFTKIQVVQKVGYIASYIESINIPDFIIKLATMNAYFFYGFCAALPKKKSFILPAMLYLAEGVFSLGTGQRNTFILHIAFLVIYFAIRSIKEKEWVGRKEKLLFLVAVPFLLVFVVWFGYSRVDTTYNSDGVFGVVYDLLYEQGVSVTVLGYQQQYQHDAIMQQNFTFGELWTFLTQNVIAKLIFGTESYAQNTIGAALHGHSFGQSISYLALGSSVFQAGRGLGSSYIAETMQDYGWVGVAAISLVYGFSMKRMKKFLEYKLPVRLFFCYVIQGLIYAPRDTAIGPFMSFFTFSAIVANLTIVIGAQIVNSNKKERRMIKQRL